MQQESCTFFKKQHKPVSGYDAAMKKPENDLVYLRRRLKETVGQHNQIAEKSGVPQSTISRIHLGATPRLDTAIKLVEELKKMEAAG